MNTEPSDIWKLLSNFDIVGPGCRPNDQVAFDF